MAAMLRTSVIAVVLSVPVLGLGQTPEFPKYWRNMDTGTVYRVIKAADRLLLTVKSVATVEEPKADTTVDVSVNQSSQREKAPSISAKREGDKYVGFYVSFTSCQRTNWKLEVEDKVCRIEIPVEFTTVTAELIDGRAKPAPANAKFDCGKCQFVGAGGAKAEWKPIAFVPVEPE